MDMIVHEKEINKDFFAQIKDIAAIDNDQLYRMKTYSVTT